MGHQDVRYYLNGLLLEVEGGTIRTIASDGHRLALFEDETNPLARESTQVIIPRKGALELFRLLAEDDTPVTVEFSANSVRVLWNELCFASKLIEGRYPDYRRVLPNHPTRKVSAEKAGLKSALTRIAVLGSEKHRGVGLEIEGGVLRLRTQNPEHEEGEEEIPIELEGEPFTAGFNASYLLEAVNNIESDEVVLSFVDASSSCLVEDRDDRRFRYIVMPMRL
jgi:DNA polymerase-3 subunit beta